MVVEGVSLSHLREQRSGERPHQPGRRGQLSHPRQVRRGHPSREVDGADASEGDWDGEESPCGGEGGGGGSDREGERGEAGHQGDAGVYLGGGG
jgi:hypothetical protein